MVKLIIECNLTLKNQVFCLVLKNVFKKTIFFSFHCFKEMKTTKLWLTLLFQRLEN